MSEKTVLNGFLQRNGERWELIGGNVPNRKVPLDLTSLDPPIDAPSHVVEFKPEEAEENPVSTLGVMEHRDGTSVFRAKRVIAHETIARFASDIASVQPRLIAQGISVHESSEEIWLRAEKELLGTARTLWWGNLFSTSDSLFIVNGNVGGSLAIHERIFSNSAALGEPVTAVGKVGEKVAFRGGLPSTKEFFLFTDQILAHNLIAARAYEISSSGGGGSAEDNWLRAEKKILES